MRGCHYEHFANIAQIWIVGQTTKKKAEARKRHLLQELEKKRKAKVHSEESAAHTGKRVVTYKNTKVTRKVDLAWLHKTNGNMKLVRLKDGGGTRVLDFQNLLPKQT